MAFFKALVAVLLVPLLGLGLALLIMSRTTSLEFQSVVVGVERCAAALPNLDSCREPHLAPALLLASLATLGFGITVIALYWLVARLCGANRIALALVFPPLTFVGLLAVALLILSHAAVVGLAVFAAESHWLGSVEPWALSVLVGLGAIAALGVAYAAVRSFGNAKIGVIGSPLNPLDQPRLMLLVRQIARKIGTRAPDNVIVGMDANFFVTHADISLPGVDGPLKGRTLFLSVPLMRGLSVSELSAIVAHELAHFANKDAAYSQRFAPVYARLNESTNSDASKRTPRNPFSVPVRVLTGFMAQAFHANVARVSQKRELAADRRAAEATSAVDLANALLKVSIMSHIWHREIMAVHERVQLGRFSRNISRNFAEHVRYDLDRTKVADAVASIMAWHVPHPTDSHPPTDERITALGLDPATLLDGGALSQRFFGQSTAADELDDLSDTEELLTFIYQKFLEHAGVGAKREMDAEDLVRFLMIDFLAHMITADGSVDDREIAVAEKAATALIPTFDARDLRERCRNPDDLTDIGRLIELALDLLTPQGFRSLSRVLEKIAKADGIQHKAEQAMLRRVLAAAELATES